MKYLTGFSHRTRHHGKGLSFQNVFHTACTGSVHNTLAVDTRMMLVPVLLDALLESRPMHGSRSVADAITRAASHIKFQTVSSSVRSMLERTASSDHCIYKLYPPGRKFRIRQERLHPLPDSAIRAFGQTILPFAVWRRCAKLNSLGLEVRSDR